MEEKKLNFNAPLLSVRRYSSPMASSDRKNGKTIKNSQPNRQLSLPSHKSDFTQVTRPVAVPFMWERIPGRPKGGSGLLSCPPEEPSISPRLPPGRGLDAIRQSLEKELEDASLFGSPSETPSSNDKVTKLEASKERIYDEGASDLESCDDAYSDALDTLSPAESCSLSCSVSGLSGSDGPGMKPSGTFATDPQTRDFMMRRFLLAAQAMTLEPPQYASRKQPVVPEQPKLLKKMISEDRRPELNQYGSNNIQLYSKDLEEEQSEDEDEDDYDYDSGNGSAKACGLISRFCLKNSLCLLNPVPGMKARSHVAKTAKIRYQSQSANKKAWSADNKQKLDHAVQPLQLNGFQNTPIVKSSQFNYFSDSQNANESSPHGSLGIGGISPSHNEASQSSFHGENYLGVPKNVENFKADSFNMDSEGSDNFSEVFYDQKNKFGSGLLSPAVEKTLYIDSVNIVLSPHSYSSSSDIKGFVHSADGEFKALVHIGGIKETSTAESSLQDIECLNVVEEKARLKPKVSGPIDANVDVSHPRFQADLVESTQDRVLDQESRSLECPKGSEVGNGVGNPYIGDKRIPETDDQGNSNVSSLRSPLPPPPPKSPSESWLWRTLPSISSKNPSSHSYLGSQFHLRKQAPKTPPSGTKWETIVKTSNVHYDHKRYSEELITHVPQQSKT